MSLGAIASIAAPIIGGLFGSKPKKDEWITPKYGDIRSKAEAAGFNPLTALTSAPGQVGSGGVTNGWGDAIAAAASSYSNYDLQKQKIGLEKTALDQRERELQLREKQFGKPIARALHISAASKAAPKKATVAVAASGSAAPSGFSGNGLPYVTAAESLEDTEKNDVRSDYLQNTDRPADFKLFGKELHGSGFFNNADRYSQEGGEPMEWLMAPVVLADAVGATAGRAAYSGYKALRFGSQYERDRYKYGSEKVRREIAAEKAAKEGARKVDKAFKGSLPVQQQFQMKWR